ncbi:MAG: TrkA family potassium uptake protein [Ruminococcaceae bacterium]|nr:TrkA family potassium uptake protein [Oscillospiraceae bacterium]
MNKNKTYAVFGLGRYGRAVASELAKGGAEVVAVDIDEEAVNDAADEIPVCKCADVTDENVLRQLGVKNFDIVIVAMAGNLEGSVMATMLLKQAGVPTVIVKCADEMHRKILSKIGADKVLLPEVESGTRLAKNLLSSGFIDVIELSKDVSMVETEVRKDWIGKSLIELSLRKKYSMNVIAIRKNNEVMIDIDPKIPLDGDMKLIVIANPERLELLR